MARSASATAPGGCSHPVLVEADGLHGFYRCRACGLVFNLVLTVAHTPRDCRAMAHHLARLGGPAPPGERYDDAPDDDEDD